MKFPVEAPACAGGGDERGGDDPGPTAHELKRLEKAVSEAIRRECPRVRWLANYAILGPHDYLDIFEAPDETVAAKVVVLIRSCTGPARSRTARDSTTT